MKKSLTAFGLLAAFVGLGLPLLSRGAVSAQEADKKAPTRADAATEDGARLRELVRDLADPSFRIREQATRDLLKEGATALPSLREGLGSKDPELKARAKQLIEEIMGARDERGRRPSRVDGSRPLDRQQRMDRQQADRTLRMLPRWNFGLDPERLDQEMETLREHLDRLHGRTESLSGRTRIPSIHQQMQEAIESLRRDFAFRGETADEGARSESESRVQIWRDGEKVVDRHFSESFASGLPLGVSVRSTDPVLRAQLPLEPEEGVVIHRVLEGGTADSAGLRQYDIITKINGETVTGVTDLQSRLRRLATERPEEPETTEIEFMRKGERQSVEVTLPAQKKRYR